MIASDESAATAAAPGKNAKRVRRAAIKSDREGIETRAGTAEPSVGRTIDASGTHEGDRQPSPPDGSTSNIEEHREHLRPNRGPTPAPISRYIDFTREEWKALRANTPLLLNEEELASLRGINEQVSLLEVEEIYVPLSRFLNLHVAAVQHLYQARREFIGSPMATKVPYVIGIAGSVAVGKSTFSRVLQASLARWIDHPRVDLITTDGFLYPNRVLDERGLMNRKGFPESYNQRRLLRFLADVKGGTPVVAAPVYSHLVYDIVPDATQEVKKPDILIIEGLNVLQSPDAQGREASKVFVSDFFDFSIYLDADEQTIERWYVDRFMRLRETVFRDEASYFHRYAELSEEEALETARVIWEEINLLNLRENIRPTRERAHLIVEKRDDHLVGRVKLRRV